jgi:hypothetical protein
MAKHGGSSRQCQDDGGGVVHQHSDIDERITPYQHWSRPHTQETRSTSTQFEKQYWCANWTDKKTSSNSFSAFIVLRKYQFGPKLLRMVQLVFQIGNITKPIKCHSSDVFVTSWESCKSGKMFAKNITCVSFFYCSQDWR